MPLILAVAATAMPPQAYPVRVRSCGRWVEVKAPPKRAVSYGSNMTEMMLALDLSSRMRGVVSRSSRLDLATPAMFPKVRTLKEVGKTLSRELLVRKRIDFVFAGWGYGMSAGGDVTPNRLSPLGIPVYTLSESCVRVGRREPPTLGFLYRDLLNLGRIFGVEPRARSLVAGYRQRVAAATRWRQPAGRPAQVFIYSGGSRAAETGGRYAMATALIEAAGGRNIMHDLTTSWARTGWETVLDRDPDVIVLITAPGFVTTPEDMIAGLARNPAARVLKAVRDRRFVALSIDALTPGPRNIDAVEQLAGAFRAWGLRR